MFFGGIREDAFYSYRIMWLNYLGHRFKLPLETPKPLFALLCGILGHGALYPVMCGFCAGICALLMKLAQKLGGSTWLGFVAFVLFLTGNTLVLPEFVLPAYYPVLYMFLIVAAVYAFITKRPITTMFFLLGAGLLRPEAWLFAPAFIIVTGFKKKRGFSWWLLVPLIAPFVWVLFDHRIAGSDTYSWDVTDYYLQTLGIMPVSFSQFWGAAAGNMAATFFLPVHCFGLAGLAYALVRTRQAGHLLMAILAVLPFAFYWLLSVVHPVLFQDRFFAFPMLVCCFYAALVLKEFFRSRFVLFFLCAMLVCVSFQFKSLSESALRVRQDRSIAEARNALVETVGNMAGNADVVICGRSAGFFAYRLGEKTSHKIFMFREAEARRDFEEHFSKGVAVYIRDDLAGLDKAFMFLSQPRIYEVNGYRFSPMKLTRGGNGIVYAVEKMSEGLILPQGMGAAPKVGKAGTNR
jgi:hypothetical protein